LTYVITLCAEEVCPMVLSSAKKLHWPFPDPASPGKSDAEKLDAFRKARDGIKARIEQFGKEYI
jgi:arsenate reductase (thioredoxin)